MRETHLAVQHVVGSTGTGVMFLGPGGACCGALHEHGGLGAQARALAERVISASPPDVPILVDSAGCGASLKGYGHLLDTEQARKFSARVYDIHEWLAAHLDELPQPAHRIAEPVAVQDPCHLRHVQKTHAAVRAVLARYATLVELDDDGLCCGAGGAYAVLQPELAVSIRQRKLAAIERSGASLVASANPGCLVHLESAGVRVRHPIDIVLAAIEGRPVA